MNPAVDPITVSSRNVTLADVARWARHFLARNPFYVLSALLLLYSIRLLSGDSRIFTHETPQLLFNFSAFQFYELLLVETAIFLAGRRIWYDSGLLAGIETLFVFVPFMLVSQALLLSNGIAMALCSAAGLLAVGRLWAFKKWLPNANLPPALLSLGGVILGLNLALPIVTRWLHQKVSFAIWDVQGATLQGWEWNGLMPLLTVGAAILPSAFVDGKKDGALYSRRFFPLLALSLWLAGTGAHLYCIGYVYGMPWENGLMAPALWAGAWMLWMRRADLDFVPEKYARIAGKILLAGPAVLVLTGEIAEWKYCGWLGLFSFVGYGTVILLRRERLAGHFAFLSLVLTAGALPHPANVAGPLALHPLPLVGCVAAGYGFLLALSSRKPVMGFIGAIILSGIVLTALPDGVGNRNLALNAGLVFALLHSLRWEGGHRTRWGLAICWIGQCLCWMSLDPDDNGRGAFASGLALLAVYYGARVVEGNRGSAVIPWTAAVGMSLGPLRIACLQCQRAPEGILILAFSFFLFVLGTMVALTKHQWSPRKEKGAQL